MHSVKTYVRYYLQVMMLRKTSTGRLQYNVAVSIICSSGSKAFCAAKSASQNDGSNSVHFSALESSNTVTCIFLPYQVWHGKA